MNTEVEQLKAQIARLEGERNAWREMVTNLFTRQHLPVPQVQPIKIEPVIIPMYPQWAPPPHQVTPYHPWWEVQPTSTCLSAGENAATVTADLGAHN